jgi:hypothetical protein
MKTQEKIKEHLKTLFFKDVNIFYTEGQFDSFCEGKSSASWGWNVPLKYNGYRIAWLQFSPPHIGEKGIVYFDYITEKDYNTKYLPNSRQIKI